MPDNFAIRVSNLKKNFVVDENNQSTAKHFFFNIFKHRASRVVFRAIKPMSFTVQKGEILGLVGRNGCGKSTLTRLIAGVYQPTSGTVEINGTTMLMNLGIGMQGELTARENIYVSASILGMSIKQIDSIFQNILHFAELEDFVDRKIKFFSSGMKTRLAFSIALNAQADIIILDEIFAVGDRKFLKKATDAIERQIMNSNKTIILISHSMELIVKYCTRCIYLHNGHIIFDGSTERAVNFYRNIS